jgi:hypothetical protein
MRRPSVLAGIGVVLAAVSMGLLAGCDGGPTPGSEAAVARQKANDTVIRQLEALPGGKVTATIESSMDGGQNNIETRAVLPATATTAQLNVMADNIERTIWLSRVDPLGRIGLIVRRQGDTDPGLERLYTSSLDTPPLRVKYGPRPDGLAD